MSDNYSLIIKNGSCYIDGKLFKTDIALLGNKIQKIGKVDLNSSKVFDATDKLVLPGIIDTQVHFREPGSTDSEDLESGSLKHTRFFCQSPGYVSVAPVSDSRWTKKSRTFVNVGDGGAWVFQKKGIDEK